MRVKNISWREHKNKEQINRDIPPISATVAQRRDRFAGHCFRAKEQVMPDVLYWRLPCSYWEPRPLNYIDMIGRDTESEIVDIPNMIRDKHLWRDVVNGILVATAKWWWLSQYKIGISHIILSVLSLKERADYYSVTVQAGKQWTRRTSLLNEICSCTEIPFPWISADGAKWKKLIS